MEEAVKIERLLKRCAEADIYLGSYFGFKAVFKVRVPKRYRDPRFDMKIRRKRTLLEARIIGLTHEIGVPAPALFDVDLERTTIVMEYIEGKTLRDAVTSDNVKEYFRELGRNIGKLHSYGIYHGDLTTSNVIVALDDRLYLIDFGLSGRTSDIEDYAIDVHLLLRALESTHYDLVDKAYKSFVEGYFSIVGSNTGNSVLRRVKEIRARGRYVEERRVRRG